jgi:hypothetical protein
MALFAKIAKILKHENFASFQRRVLYKRWLSMNCRLNAVLVVAGSIPAHDTAFLLRKPARKAGLSGCAV